MKQLTRFQKQYLQDLLLREENSIKADLKDLETEQDKKKFNQEVVVVSGLLKQNIEIQEIIRGFQ